MSRQRRGPRNHNRREELMARDPGPARFWDVLCYALRELDFPAFRWQLITAAELSGSDYRTRTALHELRNDRYASLADVARELDAYASGAHRLVGARSSGLIVQDHTKSRAGMRRIKPPSWVMDLLRRRHASSHGRWVFPSTRGTLRDPDTTRGSCGRCYAERSGPVCTRMPSGISSRQGSTRRGSRRGRSRTTSGMSGSR